MLFFYKIAPDSVPTPFLEPNWFSLEDQEGSKQWWSKGYRNCLRWECHYVLKYFWKCCAHRNRSISWRFSFIKRFTFQTGVMRTSVRTEEWCIWIVLSFKFLHTERTREQFSYKILNVRASCLSIKSETKILTHLTGTTVHTCNLHKAGGLMPTPVNPGLLPLSLTTVKPSWPTTSGSFKTEFDVFSCASLTDNEHDGFILDAGLNTGASVILVEPSQRMVEAVKTWLTFGCKL